MTRSRPKSRAQAAAKAVVGEEAANTGSKPTRIGLALAGGGPLGAIYEIGALCALDEALQGMRLHELDAYVGVSAGGFIAASLANGMTPRELYASFISNSGPVHDIFEPQVLLRPAWGEFLHRLALVPGLGLQSALRYTFRRRSVAAAIENFGRAIPTGIFSGDQIEIQLRRKFTMTGRTNDFRQLKRQLVLVATELDSGESAPFGMPGFDEVPISKAVQASAALPGLFPPVEIEGRHYVDGALKKTLHATVLLDHGVDLLLCLNPLVPFDAVHAPTHRVLAGGQPRIPKLVQGGLPAVMSQTFRTLIHSRLEIGLKRYERLYPGATVLLFEPDHRDPEMFLANTFSYAQRRELAEHAYQQTRQMLRERRAEINEKLAPHGVSICAEVLSDADRTLVGAPTARRMKRQGGFGAAIVRLERTLTELEQSLPRPSASALAFPLPAPKQLKAA
jgi:predicted acylesterase/phospholipase RssA